MTKPKKRGPKPSGQQPKRAINFWVGADDHAWLTALANRSAWIADKIAQDRAVATRFSPSEEPNSNG